MSEQQIVDVVWNPVSVERGETAIHLQRGCDPLRMRKAKVIGIKGDWAHKDVPDEFIDRMMAVVALCPQHQFVLLTKRPERAVEYATRLQAMFTDMGTFLESDLAQATRDVSHAAGHDWPQNAPLSWLNPERGEGLGGYTGEVGFPPRNVWMGVSVEDQPTADERREATLRIAALEWKTWVSYEPALGLPDWEPWFAEIDRNGEPCGPRQFHPLCIVTGGESGPKARPAHPDWFRQTRDACAEAGVGHFHKQNGEWAHNVNSPSRLRQHLVVHPDGSAHHPLTACPLAGGCWADGRVVMARVGKKAAGRMPDGVKSPLDALPWFQALSSQPIVDNSEVG